MTAVPGALLLERSSKAPPPARKRAPGRGKKVGRPRRDPADNGARV